MNPYPRPAAHREPGGTPATAAQSGPPPADLRELRGLRLAFGIPAGVTVVGSYLLIALLAGDWNAASLAFLAFAIAASSLVPTIVYTLFWPRFTAGGALLGLYGGLGCSLVLVAFSPLVSSTPASLLPSADVAWFPLQNPGIVSVPVGFLLGWLGTVLSSKTTDDAAYRAFEERCLTAAE
ncbi:sodium:solute symporter family transporter [Streptomyces sp. NPDC054833]